MTGRQLRRSARRHPVLAAVAAVVGVLVVTDVARAMRWLVAIAAAAAIMYAVRQARRPGRPAGPAPVRPVTPPPASADPRSWTGGPVAAGSASRGHLRAVPPSEPPELAGLRAERDQLADRVRQLEQDLAGAREGMHAAWDAAASVTVRPPDRDDDAVDRLLADPLSGARRIG